MGRFPVEFAGRRITFRIPYLIPGEIEVGPERTGVVFPEAVFLHNVDKPFEIHRMIVRLTPKATVQYEGQDLAVLQPLTSGIVVPPELDKLVRIKVIDFSKNENLTKSPVLVGALMERVFETWEWEEPYTLVRSEGLQVQLDTQQFPSVCVTGLQGYGCAEPHPVGIELLRVEITFQGFLIVVASPSSSR